MVMSWEEYQEKITALNENIGDPETIAETITTLSEDYSNVIKERTEFERLITEKDSQIEKMTRANTKLTLSVGDTFAPPESIRNKKESDELNNVTLSMLAERKVL